MKMLSFLAILSFASFSMAVSSDIQCQDNETGKSVSFDFRRGLANIYVCDSTGAACDSKNVEPDEQAVIVKDTTGEFDPITYGVQAGSNPLPAGSRFVLQFHEDPSLVEIKPEGDESRFSCSTGLPPSDNN